MNPDLDWYVVGWSLLTHNTYLVVELSGENVTCKAAYSSYGMSFPPLRISMSSYNCRLAYDGLHASHSERADDYSISNFIGIIFGLSICYVNITRFIFGWSLLRAFRLQLSTNGVLHLS